LPSLAVTREPLRTGMLDTGKGAFDGTGAEQNGTGIRGATLPAFARAARIVVTSGAIAAASPAAAVFDAASLPISARVSAGTLAAGATARSTGTRCLARMFWRASDGKRCS